MNQQYSSLEEEQLLNRIFVPINLGGQNLDIANNSSTLPQFHKFITKNENAINLTDMIE